SRDWSSDVCSSDLGSIGTSLAYLVGASTLYLSTWLQAHAGLLGSFRDWQLVFIFSGLAGLILALLFGLTVREPVRRETAPSTSGAPRLGQILRDLSRSEEHTSELQSRENLVCRL